MEGAWCIFHYPSKIQHPTKAEELLERFNREFVDERRKQEEEHPDFLDFTEFDFPDEVTFEKELSKVYFTKAIFRKGVSFELNGLNDEKSFVFEGEARFHGATFKGSARFNIVTFERIAWFDGATFERDAWFSEAIFKKSAIFDNATFKGYARFGSVTFEGSAQFGRVTFEDYVDFKKAIFEKLSWFGMATFEENTWFSEATFEGPTGFNRVTFKGDTEFTMLSISSQVLFKNHIIERIFTLNISQWKQHGENDDYTVDIRDPLFGEYGKLIITRSLGTTQGFMAGISLLDTEMEKIEFIEEDWPRLYHRKTIIDEVFLTKEIEDNVEPPHTVSPERVAQTYRRLRKNYEDARRYSDAGDFLIGEMEVTRKYTQDTDGTNIRRSYMDLTWILHSLYFILGKYGESIGRPLIWLSSIWIIVSELQFFYLYKPQEYSNFIWCLLESSYITLSAMFPLTSVKGPFDFFMKLIGSLLIGLIFIALRRRLERK